MKNKTTFIIAVVFVATLSGLFILKNKTSFQKTAQAMTPAQKKLPSFSFYALNGKSVFSDKDIAREKKLCIVYFDPECDYCENEITSIVKNINAFKNAEILLVSANTPAKIESMRDKFKLNQFVNIRLLWDKDLNFEGLFGKSVIPSSYIYSNDMVLLKEYHGLVDINAITKWLKV